MHKDQDTPVLSRTHLPSVHMSSQTTRTISQNFRISLDDSSQTLSVDVIVSNGGDIQLDVRDRATKTSISVGRRYLHLVHDPHTPLCRGIIFKSGSTDTAVEYARIKPPVTARINDECDIPPPAYAQYEPPNAPTPPPPAPEPLVPPVPDSIVYRETGPIEFDPNQHRSRLSSPPPIRPILRELYEAMQRGDFVPQIVVDEPEQPTFPLNLSGRRRRYEEYSDDEDEDEDEERYAKRNRASSRLSKSPHLATYVRDLTIDLPADSADEDIPLEHVLQTVQNLEHFVISGFDICWSGLSLPLASALLNILHGPSSSTCIF
ncbi:hypothetical protein FB451DRAFT_1417304 [Mycena latifolia]|nr:hypothetical protein FB451DRAFT_1417304 [Mycena latifolia]